MKKKKMAFYSFSLSNQIVGNGRISTELRPFRIETNTWQIVYFEKSKLNETPAYIQVSFALSDLENDGDIAHLSQGGGVIESDLEVLDYTGLLDVTMAEDTAVTVTATTFSIDMSLIYGDQGHKTPFTGGLLADFTFAGAPPTSVTESSTVDGNYTFVVPTFSGTETLSFFKEGFYASDITITLP